MGLGQTVSIGFAAACLIYFACSLLSNLAQSVTAEDAIGSSLPSVVWMAPILAGGGYSSEAISYAVALDQEYGESQSRFGLRQFAEHQNADFIQGLPENTMQVISRLMAVGSARSQRLRWDVAVCHATPDTWHPDGAFGWGYVNPCPPPDARFSVGRTMYETDRLPDKWVERINQMDEIWVPSAFAVEQFAQSGVERSKIVVVPEAVDTTLFDPDLHKPLDLTAAHRKGKGKGKVNTTAAEPFRFLSVFKWEKRKGWEVLLKAYFEEFSADDNVELVLKTSQFHDNTDFEDKIQKFVKKLSAAKNPQPRYAVLGTSLPLRELPRLYRAVDAFVLPSRGEGWGRPHVEAMAMSLPIIATNWSGSTEFLSEQCALPLRIDGLSEVDEGPKGHRWAEPSITHLRSLMRWVFENPVDAKLIGKRAREEMVTRFSPQVVVRDHVMPQLDRIAGRLPKKKKGKKKSSEL